MKPTITFQQCVNIVTIISSYFNVSTLRGPHLETPNSGIPYHITPAEELTPFNVTDGKAACVLDGTVPLFHGTYYSVTTISVFKEVSEQIYLNRSF
jgi:hypothetical protein